MISYYMLYTFLTDFLIDIPYSFRNRLDNFQILSVGRCNNPHMIGHSPFSSSKYFSTTLASSNNIWVYIDFTLHPVCMQYSFNNFHAYLFLYGVHVVIFKCMCSYNSVSFYGLFYTYHYHHYTFSWKHMFSRWSHRNIFVSLT